MATRISREELMRYLDGELPSPERRRVESALEESTELQRELAIFKGLHEDFLELSFQPPPRNGLWDEVNRRVTRPIGWLLLVSGSATWAAYGAYLFWKSPGDLFEKMVAGAVVIGVLLLLASVIWEQYRDWLRDPYKDVHR